MFLSTGFEIRPNDAGKTRCVDWGGGRVANPYPVEFFPWWRRQIVAIDDYPYVGIDFWGDPNMPLPLGSAYGDIGNESRPLLFFKNFEVFNFFVFS